MLRYLLLSTTLFLISCAHNKGQNKNKNISTHNSKVVVYDESTMEDDVSQILSATNKKEATQETIEKLLDDTDEPDQLDDSNKISNEDRVYTEEDRAEDVVDKLLTEENKSNDEVDIQSNFITVKNHPLVHKWIRYFTQTDRARFIRFMKNGAKYRSSIEKIFDEEGVPRGLFFVGMIESGFFLKAKSHANAVGPWQFIRGTGKRYGLTISRTLDERKDLYKSTRAAARYFRDLYKIFGSWELALSAYNAGEYGIMRRIKRARSENFFNLANRGYLLPETANYVPKVMATIHIYQNLEKFGYTELTEENPFEKTVQVKLKHSHSLRYIANVLGISYETLQFLNSELPTPYTPYVNNGFYKLRIPQSAWEERAQDLIAALSNKHSRTPLATVKRYESPEKSRFSKSSRAIKKREVTFRKGSNNSNLIKTNQPLIYTVQSGDNISSLAKQFKTTPQILKSANKLSSNVVMKGQRLKIPKKLRTYYEVKRGDNLYSIARKFNLTPNFIKQLNSLTGLDLYAGQKILILL